MAKIKPDEIKWILSLDAQGVQTELREMRSEAERLAIENKNLTKSLKEAEKTLQASEKAMAKLVAQGKENSAEYERLEATARAAREEIERDTKSIGANKKAMEENKETYQETIKTMDLSSMTMAQLRERSKMLNEQLIHTSKAADPEVWNKLNNELQATKEQMGNLSTGGQSLMDKFSSLPGPAGMAARSVKGLAQAMKLLIANPVGIVIMLIVAAFYALKTAIAGSDTATTKYNAVLAIFGSVLDSVKRIVTELFAALYNLYNLDFSAFKKNLSNMKEIGGAMKENAQAAHDAVIAEDALNDVIARNNDLTEVNKARSSELRQIMRDTTRSIEERSAAAKEAIQLEEANYKMSLQNITGQYEVFKGKNQGMMDAIKRSQGEQFAQVERYMQMVQEGTELTFAQRQELANLVNDITTNLDEATEEDKERFRSYFSDISKMQKEFHDGSRREILEAGRIEIEVRKKREEAAKKTIETALKNADRAQSEELITLKAGLLEGTLAREDYEQEQQRIALESLQRKLSIAGLEKDARMQLEQQLLDLQLQMADKAQKAKEEADKKSLQEAKNTHSAQLNDVEAQSTALKTAYQKRYAEGLISEHQLQAAIQSVDAETAEQRLKLKTEYQADVMNIEFATATIQAQAIDEANKQVLEADARATQSRVEQMKILQSLVGDFKKQFKLTTVDEDTQAQMEALSAIYQARREMAEKAGMDTAEIDAAFERAKTQILEEEEAKRFNVRQRYGLTSLKELHDKEFEMLEQQREQGLIDEEEYQKAKVNLMVKHSKAAFDMFHSLVSGAVKSLQEAETANIDEKYDAEIQAAGDNAEEVARIEQEKEQKKLDVQKKYADVNFAIKAGEIIANTAVSIMKSIAELGPIAGPIAAALMGVTGAAQLAVANSERNKIKSMTLSGGGGSKAASTGRIVVHGRQSGGYLDVERSQDARRFRAKYDPTRRGYVDRPTVIVGEGPLGQSREFVLSNDALQNPSIAPLVDALDQAQSAGEIRTVDINQIMRRRMAGFASGGFLDDSSRTASSPARKTDRGTENLSPQELKALLDDLRNLLQHLKDNGVKAPIVLSELQKKQALLEKSENIGSK